MKQRYIQSNFYTTTLSSGVSLVPATTGRTAIPLTALPTVADNKYYHIIYNPTDSLTRYITRAYNEGGFCYVDKCDLISSKTFVTKKQVAIFDVAEMFNELYKNTDDFGLVEKKGPIGLLVSVRGGIVSHIADIPDMINDTSITVTDNAITYIHYDSIGKVFSQNISLQNGFNCAKITASSGNITSIEDYRPSVFIG